jgi:hypothetical protein
MKYQKRKRKNNWFSNICEYKFIHKYIVVFVNWCTNTQGRSFQWVDDSLVKSHTWYDDFNILHIEVRRTLNCINCIATPILTWPAPVSINKRKKKFLIQKQITNNNCARARFFFLKNSAKQKIIVICPKMCYLLKIKVLRISKIKK